MSEKEASLDLNATLVQLDVKEGVVKEIPASSQEFGSFDTGIEVPQEIIRESYKRESIKEQTGEENVVQRAEEKTKGSTKDSVKSRYDGMER